jgi:hypothetical protein
MMKSVAGGGQGMKTLRNMYKILDGKREGRSRSRWRNNIEVNFRGVSFVGIVEKPPSNSAGFCGGGQGLNWAVEPRKEE